MFTFCFCLNLFAPFQHGEVSSDWYVIVQFVLHVLKHGFDCMGVCAIVVRVIWQNYTALLYHIKKCKLQQWFSFIDESVFVGFGVKVECHWH